MPASSNYLFKAELTFSKFGQEKFSRLRKNSGKSLHTWEAGDSADSEAIAFQLACFMRTTDPERIPMKGTEGTIEKIKKIFAPTDLSENSRAGVRYALNLARSLDSAQGSLSNRAPVVVAFLRDLRALRG